MLPSLDLQSEEGIIAPVQEDTHRPADYPEDQVRVLDVGGKTFILVGTAHISKESVDLVRLVIEREKPDAVCVELDAQRYQALTQERRWESLDLKEIIRNKQLPTLLINLLLYAYQKKLGMKLGVMPGTELLEATRTAERLSIPYILCDRDVRVTLRRAWRTTPFLKKMMLLSAVVAAVFEEKEISEEQIQEVLQRDALNELMQELGKALPTLKRVLIDERDSYIAQKMREVEGSRIVSVVGAGHLNGIEALLKSREKPDMRTISLIPPASPIWKWVGWGIPALILGSIAYIGWMQGLGAAGDNALYWILANSIPSAIGAILALAHPAAIATAFVSAPITSLTPVIGAAHVTAFVQAYFRPPRVHEFHTIAEDAGKPKRWWGNRLLRIFLAFLLPGIGSMIGSWIGGVEIVTNLFGK